MAFLLSGYMECNGEIEFEKLTKRAKDGAASMVCCVFLYLGSLLFYTLFLFEESTTLIYSYIFHLVVLSLSLKILVSEAMKSERLICSIYKKLNIMKTTE